EDVERVAVGDLAAVRALVAGLRGRPALAVERLRQQPRRRRLADAPRPGEEERVGYAVRGDRGLERPRDVLLTDDVLETLRPEAAGEYLVGHEGSPGRPMVTARVPCGTGGQSVPLLPSGPDGVRDAFLRRT